MARPPLPRYRRTLLVEVDLGASDAEHADQRIEAIADLTARHITATVRNTRLGAPTVTDVRAGTR